MGLGHLMVGRGLLLVFVICILGGVSFAALGTAGEDAGTEPAAEDPLADEVGTTASSLVWSSKMTGDLALRFELDFSTWTSCSMKIKSGGWLSGNSVLSYHARDVPGGAWSMFTDDLTTTAHASTVSFRESSQYNAWASEHILWFSGAATQPFLFVASDLTPWNNVITNGESIIIEIDCGDAFTLSEVQGGRSVVAATPSYMTGGAGAHAAGTAVNAADTLGGTFSEPDVVFRYRTDQWYGAGLVTLDGPGNTDGSWLVLGNGRVDVDGGSGTYQAGLTQASALGTGAMILAGLQPIGSFDDAAAL